MYATAGLQRNHWWNWDRPFEIDITRRIGVYGATGSGKSTILQRIIAAYIENDVGFTLIDPHGELADWTLSRIPSDRANDLIYFAPRFDGEFFIPINPLDGKNKPKRFKDTIELVADTWNNAWGPQSDFESRNVGEALTEVIPNATLLHFDRAFMSRDYMQQLADRATSPHTKAFFEKVMTSWDKRQQEQAAAPATNKFNSFNQPLVRHVVGNIKSLDFGRMMDDRRIFIANLDVGEIGDDYATILALLIQDSLVHAAFERDLTKPHPMHPLIIDEAHKFTRGSKLKTFLTETRKYGIPLILSDQGIDGLPEGTESAIFNNVETLLAGRVSSTNAARLGAELRLQNPFALQGLNDFEWFGKTKQDRMTTDAIRFEGLGPPPPPAKRPKRKNMIRRSNERFAIRAEVIEDNLARFSMN